MKLPQAFIQQMQTQLGDEFDSFLDALVKEIPTSIRLNPHKETTPLSKLQDVAWCKQGKYLTERPIFTLDPAFHAGAYYVQEASSMFVAEAIRQTIQSDTPLKVLDLCAAPGGKSTLLSSYLPESSLLVSNEVIKSRYQILKENMLKWGYPHIALTNHDPADFSGLISFFDVVLIDAPCSGEGMFRKDENAVKEWSPQLVKLCSARQQRILKDALKLLKKDGILLYSTCTYNDAENIDNLDWVLNNYDLQAIPMTLPKEWKVDEQSGKKAIGYQFYPHKIKGEGFFIGVLKKINNPTSLNKPSKKRKIVFKQLQTLSKKQINIITPWIKNPSTYSLFQTPNEQIVALSNQHLADYWQLDQHLRRKKFGVSIGQLKKDIFIPSHELALSHLLNPSIPSLDVDKQQALSFLKKEPLDLQISLKGWIVIKYKGLSLGWIKAVPGRINNYLPKELRIRMDISKERDKNKLRFSSEY